MGRQGTRRNQTAERVSDRDASDNYVYQRSLLAYREAAAMVSGDVLEIGTGSGYGISVVAPRVKTLMTVDKFMPPIDVMPYGNVEFRQMSVPPLAGIGDNRFDYVISFQVIEHIRDDFAFVREIERVLKPGGRLIITTPNAPMSITRNPWHIREYTSGQLKTLLGSFFASVEAKGICGNRKIMTYYEKNKASVARITRFDPLKLQYRLPRWMLRLPYDLLNRLNRRRLLVENRTLTAGITPDDYRLADADDHCFDLFFIARKAG